MAKKTISYILSFILVILLLSSIVIGLLSQTILSEKYMLKLLEKNDYYASIYNEIMDNFENNTIQSGLSNDVLDNIITEDKVRDDVNNLISYLYNNKKTFEIDVDSVRTKLQENIAKEVEENNKTVTEEEQEDIDTYVETIVEIYKNGIEYSEEYIESIQKGVSSILKLVSGKMDITVYVVTILVILVLILIKKWSSLKYISTSFISTGILMIIIKIAVSASTHISDIYILNKAFSAVLVSLLGNIMTGCLILGIILVIAGIIGSIISTRVDDEI